MKHSTIAMLAGSAAILLGLGMLATAGYDEYREYGETSESHEYSRFWPGLLSDDDAGRRTSYQQDAIYPVYQNECGDCHIAYPPNMLPQQSWHTMLQSLDQHFGDNAELDTDRAASIADFLDRHAAGQARGGYSARMWRSAANDGKLLRITDSDYFRGKHHEIPSRLVLDNAEVNSFSRCQACHRRAEQGSFNEHEVNIPGFGRWDD
ncbi:MAG: cytochrome C [Chromatiales bacterium]|jgi:hypothetical protein